MSPTAQIQAFAQSVYLVIKNRYFDDITGADGIVFVQQVVDWANQFLDELEMETNPDGTPIDWLWNRQLGYTLGSATEGAASITAPTAILSLIAAEHRYVQVLQGSTVISNWAVVSPNQISSQSDRITEDMVTFVGGKLAFSRAFRDTENGGTIIGDVTLPVPRLAVNAQGEAINVKAFSVVKPKQLMILGVAKNATLPDIVQGGLSPSYAQKYGDLLAGAIARNAATGYSDLVTRDDLGYIGGIGF